MRWSFLFSFYYWGKGGSPEVNHFANRVPHSQSYGFSSSHVWMWELDHKEGWEPKNWCFLIVVVEKTLESPIDSKEIKQVNPKENQPWIFIGRIDAEAEAPRLWPPDMKSQLIWKYPDAWKDWRQEKGMTEEEMVGWHQWTWVRATLRRYWRAGKTSMLQSVGSQRVGHSLVKLNNSKR